MTNLKASADHGNVKPDDVVDVTIRGARLIDVVALPTGADELMIVKHHGRQYYFKVGSKDVTVKATDLVEHVAVTERECRCGWQVDRAVAPVHFEREMALHFAAESVTS